MKDRAVEWAYAVAWRLVRVLPERVVAAIFRLGADRAARRRGPAVSRLAANLRQVVGGDLPDALVRDATRSYARYWLEAFRLPSRSPEQIRAGFVLHGHEALLDNVAAGCGSIVVLPHAGNWDAAGAWVAAMGMPITTVAERLQPEGLYRRFLAFRQGLGMEILPLTGGDRPTMDVLAERIGTGTVVPLLADRDFSTRGVEVTFFDRRTKMPAGPAILALRTGAPLYVVAMWYESSGPVGQMSPPLPLPDPSSGSLDERVRTVTQMIADRFADGIREHPADWHMMGRMFMADTASAGTASDGTAGDGTAGDGTASDGTASDGIASADIASAGTASGGTGVTTTADADAVAGPR